MADRVDVQRVPALAASVILQAVEQRPEPLGYAHPAQRDGLLRRYPNSHEDSFSSLRPAGAGALSAVFRLGFDALAGGHDVFSTSG